MRNWWIALRSLRRKPRSTGAAIFVLACGMGAVTVTLSLGHILVAHPLPWNSADRTLVIRQTRQADNKALTDLAPANFVDLLDSTHVFEKVAATIGISRVLRGGSYPEALRGVAASAELFSLLGIKPKIGRWYGEQERNAVLISEDVWQRQFDGSPDALGRAVELDGHAHQIIGVLPRRLGYPEEADFWVPLNSFAALFSIRQVPLFSVLAHLKTGEELGRAQSELDLLAARLRQQHPASAGGLRFIPVPLRNALFGNVKPVLIALLTASAVLLAVACINLMTILFSATMDRRQEIAIQLALGASKGRLRAQFLRESLLISCIGGILGVVLTPLLFHFVYRMLPQHSILYGNFSLNAISLLFATITTLSCGFAFGTVPMLLHTERHLMLPLMSEGIHIGSSRASTSWNLMVVFEVALTMALCVGAGLMCKSLWRVTHAELGFKPENVLAVRVNLPAVQDSRSYAKIAEAGELLNRLSVLPGVESGGIATFVPLSGKQSEYDVFLPQTDSSSGSKASGVSVAVISGDYFGTLRVPIRRGRPLLTSDSADSPKVCLVNQAFADSYFAGVNPIGGTISVAKAEEKYRIVGVVGNIRGLSVTQPPRETVFLAYAQAPWAQFDIVLRTSSDPSTLIASVEKTVRTLDPELVLLRVTTIEELLENSLTDRRMRTTFLAIYAILCLILAGTGLYAVVTHAAQRRRKEIALRIALGATRPRIFRLIFSHGIIPVVAGVSAGTVLSMSLSHIIAASLYGVFPNDVVTFMSVGAFISLLGISAASIPASRACRLDPVHWLRYQ